MKFLTKNKKTADKEIAAGRDDEKQEVQNQTEDDMDEESLANGRDNVIEVKRTMGKKGKMLLAIAAIVVVLGLVTALLRYNAIKTYTQYDVVSATETSGDNIADYTVFAGNVLKVTKDGASYIDEKKKQSRQQSDDNHGHGTL